MTTTILLDIDIPIFRFAAVHQSNIQWEPGEGEVVAVVPEFEYVADQLDIYVDELMEELHADDIIMCLSEPLRDRNWRRKVLPTYKDNRSKSTTPVYRTKLGEYIEHKYKTYRRPTLEGDDILGILATSNKLVPGYKIVVSGDKDLKTIPTVETSIGRNTLYNPDKDKVPMVRPLHEADWYWMYQTLVGDSTDGYKGLPRCGPVGAKKVLGEPCEGMTVEHLWPLVVNAYTDKGLTEADALVQAQVARICRVEDYDYKLGEVIPWEPSTENTH